MNRLTFVLFMLVAGLFAVIIAPGFVFSVVITAVVTVLLIRWFARAATRPRRGVWR
ncbi:hypothetical protein JK358_34250 [Nocardia sp. 2]|uniref:Uncharacterized protein n=1 Tax=Nocardia acididurans TaxID=2802282 RepID=A0ABS1MHE1_9NOCA|nr:hypothetical protein [Nocardia acididurans]MBL1079480.1 hypothetical protein [Nocardia acididurans]